MNDRAPFIPDDAVDAGRQNRLLFRYWKDRYAAMLLEDVLRPRQPIRALRQGRFARLLDRPAIKALAASKGDGWLDRDDLLSLWPADVLTYVMSFGAWGSSRRSERRWNQTSRPRRQLVLQLNFSRQHDEKYHLLVSDAKDMPFADWYHPINKRGRITMAWARIDIDLASGEALIDEVQNDWIRNVEAELADDDRDFGIYRKPAERKNFRIYAENVLAPHAGLWSEAVLSAALLVLGQVFRIDRVWFHDFDTGCEIKKITGRKPPRSLYGDLPRRFCFEPTDEPPEFILATQPRRLRKKLERREGRFWRLDGPSRRAASRHDGP